LKELPMAEAELVRITATTVFVLMVGLIVWRRWRRR
jgi:hypothetical protein